MRVGGKQRGLRGTVGALALALVFALVAAACSSGGDASRVQEALTGTTAADGGDGGDGGVPEPSIPAGEGGSWTVMVYGMGDNDLEPFLLEDLAEMAAVGSTDEVNIVVLADRSPDYSADPVVNLPDFTDTRLLHVQPGELVDVATPTEVNNGDPATLAGFIEVAASSFPADRYALVFWDHGGGWTGMGPDEDAGFDVLDLAEIEQGMSDGMAAAGIDRLDLVGFDACLMATYEVASRMVGFADYMLASAELEPGHGWNWTALSVLTQNPAATPEDLANSIMAGFQQQAQEQGTEAEITLSLLDLNAMGGLHDQLGALAQAAAGDLATLAPTFGAARTDVLAYGFSPDPAQNSNLIDLGLFVDNLVAAGVDASGVRAALDTVVVSSINGPVTEGSSGMSIYFPQFPEEFGQGYLFLQGIPHWPDFLTAFYEVGQAIPPAQQPSFVNSDGRAEYFFDQDGLNIFGTFDLAAEGNIVQTTIYYGILDENDGSIIYLGEEPGEASTDGSGLAGAIFDLTVLTMSDGIDTAYAYLVLNFDESTGYALIDIPLDYQAPENFGTDLYSELILSVVVDPTDGTVISETYYEFDPASGAYGEASLDPNGLIFPVVLNQYPDGTLEWIPTIDVGLFADLPNIAYNLERLPSGTGLYAELAVYDFAGNVDAVSMFDLVP